MPQHIQHSLIHVLLLWTTILSIVQVVSIVLFFKVERFNQCQNCNAVVPDPKKQFDVNINTRQSPPDFLLSKGKMANFVSRGVHENKTINWEDDDSSGLLSSGYVLRIRKDGYYFLSLRVTLECSGNEHTGKQMEKMSLKKDNIDILQGWIDAHTCSTGVLSKVEKLAAGSTLMVTINSTQTKINTTDDGSFTCLSVIYMEQPETQD